MSDYNSQPMQPGIYASDLEHQALNANAAEYFPGKPMMFTPIESTDNSVYYKSNIGQPKYYHPNPQGSEFVAPISPIAAVSGSGYAPPSPMQFEPQMYEPMSRETMHQNATNGPPPQQSFGYNPEQKGGGGHRNQFRERGRGHNNNNRGRGRGGYKPQFQDRNSEFNNPPPHRGNFRGQRSYQAMSYQNRNRDFYDNNSHDVIPTDDYDELRNKNQYYYNGPGDKQQYKKVKDDDQYGRDNYRNIGFNDREKVGVEDAVHTAKGDNYKSRQNERGGPYTRSKVVAKDGRERQNESGGPYNRSKDVAKDGRERQSERGGPYNRSKDVAKDGRERQNERGGPSYNRNKDVAKDGRERQNENRVTGQSSGGMEDGRERRNKQGPDNYYDYNNDRADPGNGRGRHPATKRENNFSGDQRSYNNYNDSKGARPKYGNNRWMNTSSTADKDESQRGSLTDQLSHNAYECMVCCDIIKVDSAIWSCDNCYHVFHLHCTKKWAHSSKDKESNSWRCPGCQNESSSIPSQYRCFCGRRKDPRYVRGETPHSCGDACRKKRKGNCKHSCTILCHPGPCPPCSSMVNQPCDCRKERKSMRCSVAAPFKCDTVCGKDLSCGRHQCNDICHEGNCPMCTVSKSQGCYCGKKDRNVLCGTSQYGMVSYSCEESCGRTLSCSNHLCEVVCHPGECAPCTADPSVQTACCCGKTPLSELNVADRLSCLDPIPTCGQICNKPMACGPKDDHHLCERPCHEGECGPCHKETAVTCRCLRMEKEFPCETAVAYNERNPFKCQKRCGKKKTCGRHKCSDNCCVKDFHICEYICGMKLTCGVHKCKEICHRGNCKRCLETSFDEMSCYCGATVMEPPIPCGTKPPECHQLCPRKQDCGHPIRHNCHMDDDCPPCTELTEKPCMGGHTVRKNIPCHMKTISCGMPCKKELSCKMHQCQKVCHKAPCLGEGGSCTQPCTKPRPACGHSCGAPCHDGHCPATFCKTEIVIVCRCGNRSTKMECQMGGDHTAEIAQFQRLSVQSIAEYGGEGVDLAQFSQTKPGSRKLDCDTTCAVLERNKRIALALEIKNPDMTGKLGTPTFTDFIKDYGRRNAAFAMSVEKSIVGLVQMAQKSLQPHRSHSFPSMNRDQRRFIHELAEFYGCQTQSYDYEPNKNVVATAHKDKCWMPNGNLTQLLKDQSMKAPPPLSGLKTQGVTFTVLEKKKTAPPPQEVPAPNRAWESTSLSSTSVSSAGSNKPGPTVDYFDFTEN